ncbi:MAG: tetratricopeptide repeat protein [Rubrivivax sp.]|nr:tetratricopeptide repeat protein [Rubrivivax sp.]
MTDETRFAAARDRFTEGLAHLQAGRAAEAEAALRESLALLPGRPSTLLNLAVALLRQGRPAEALPLLDQVLVAEPGDADALGHRAVALQALQQPAEAQASLERLVQAAPARPEAWFHLGQVRHQQGDAAGALAAYERCLALRDDHGPAWSQRGQALKDLGRIDQAAASFERALALGDDPELNAYYLAGLRGGAAPARPPRWYVQRLFDDYAPAFDQHLVETLGYCAPEVLQRLIVGAGTASFESALDLGCGTGLCGPLLRPLAARLAGVDLSAAMLDAARGRGVYEALHQADLVEHLMTTGGRHDLIVAADVFIYVGDLAPVFDGIARVLRPGGLLAFSVEPAPAEAAFVLQPSLRYAHGEAAIRALAAQHGLAVTAQERGALRADEVHPVQGGYWVLRAG